MLVFFHLRDASVILSDVPQNHSRAEPKMLVPGPTLNAPGVAVGYPKLGPFVPHTRSGGRAGVRSPPTCGAGTLRPGATLPRCQGAEV